MEKLYIIVPLLLSIGISGCSKERRADRAGEKMQDFIIDISNYAAKHDADFIIIPQNGLELAFNYLDPDDGLKGSYMAAVDGFGVEELFYDGTLATDQERLDMARVLAQQKKVMVADQIDQPSSMEDAIKRSLDEGFICFPRSPENHDYLEIPDSVINENTDDIQKLEDAKNYLYLISDERFTDKASMLNAIRATNYDVVLIDLFFQEVAFTKSEIESIGKKANGHERLVIAYMNIGAAEKYRYYWKKDWKLHRPNWLKKEYDGYEDEIWVKFWKKDWQEVIYGNDNSYTKRIINAGFDGAYLDNVEAYYFLYFDE